jgi:cytochrome c peroxidase
MFKRGVSILCAIFLSLTIATAAFAEFQERLGRLLFFDRHLSKNRNQSCATCHDPSEGFVDPINVRLPAYIPVSVGSDVSLSGDRNAPSSGYAKFSPPFFFDTEAGLYTGGQFLDGRASTLADQAKGPFLNPLEMGMADEAAVIAALKDPSNRNAADYQILFKKIYDIDLAVINTTNVNASVLDAYDKLAQAIGEFEKSVAFAPFTSKFDQVMIEKATFTDAEARGWAVFNGKGKLRGLSSGIRLPPS